MPRETKSKSRYIFILVRFAVVLGGIAYAIYWLSQNDRWNQLKAAFANIKPATFIFALVIFLIGHVLIALRWALLLSTQQIYIGKLTAVKLYYLGWFYNNFMPGAVGGDLVRAWYVTRHTDKRLHAALSVFADRVVGLISTLSIAVFCYFVLLEDGADITIQGPGKIIESITKYRAIIFLSIPAIVIVAAVLAIPGPTRRLMVKLWRLSYLHTERLFGRCRDAVALYCRSPLKLLAAYGLTVFIQIIIINGFILVGRDLELGAPMKAYYVVFPLTWVFGAVPVSIGGAVIVESLLAYLFVQTAGVQAESALVLALCQRIIWMLASLPGAVIHLSGAHLPKEISVDY